MSSGDQEALALANKLVNGPCSSWSEHSEDLQSAHDAIRRLVAERAEWSERACNLQHELNVALRERDQARFDLATSVRATTEHGETIVADRAAMRQALEALENGRRVRNCEGGTKYQPPLEDAAISSLKARVQ